MKFETLAKTFSKKILPDSEVELAGEVPAETVGEYRAQALQTIAESLDVPGFRKGKVPEHLALKKVGEVTVLEEAVNLFVRDFYPELVEVLKLEVVGRPNIAITKLPAPPAGGPVGLAVRAALYPEVTLPKGWLKTGEKIPLEMTLPATDEEVVQTLEQLRASRKSPFRRDEHDPNSSAETSALPELNDEFAKSVGVFETLDALKAQIKKGIGEEKERAAKDKRRGRIIERLLANVKVEIPRIFVESELDKIISQMKEDVARMANLASPNARSEGFRGFTFEDYLKHTNKTEEQLRADFKDQARRRAKTQLTLNKIAAEEKVEPDKEAVERELKHALEHFPNAKPELVRIHIETVLRNEKVLQMLEGAIT